MNASVDDVALEAGRVIGRLENMPIGRIDDRVAELVRSAATRILDLTDDPERPVDARLPVVGPTAVAAQLAVVVDDYQARRTHPETTTTASKDAAVAQILVDLRQSLP